VAPPLAGGAGSGDNRTSIFALAADRQVPDSAASCPDLPSCGCAADAAAAELPRALMRLLALALAAGAACGSALALLGYIWACSP
jgi:hypothetical protein